MAESVSNICRNCLQQIAENEQFYFLNNEKGLMLQSKLLDFLPEIALNATENPIICNRCTFTIDGIHKFKQQTPFEDVLNYVKKETIKEELVEDTIIDEPQIVDDNCIQVNTDLPVCIEAPTKPLFYCYTCNYNTNTKRDLARHVHSHRPQFLKIRRFKCNECRYTTPNNYCLTAHKKIHLKTESIIIDLQMQQKLFRDVLNYVTKGTVHDDEDTIIDKQQIVDDGCLQVNTNQRLFLCHYCNYRTNQKDSFKYHITLHHNFKPFVCDVCHFNTHSKADLKTHMLTHVHKSNQHMPIHEGLKLFVCGKCDFSSKFKHNLMRHMIHIHNREKLAKNYKCGECGYSSVFKQNLKSHVISMHNRVKNYKCRQCDYLSNNKHNLKSHVINMHTKKRLVKNHKCGECEYATNYKTDLVTHIRSHTGEKPFKCNICDYRCTQNSNLKSHLTTHTGEKSLKCILCSYACNQRRDMNNHHQQHFKKPVIKCDKCSFKTLRNYDLKRHQLIHGS